MSQREFAEIRHCNMLAQRLLFAGTMNVNINAIGLLFAAMLANGCTVATDDQFTEPSEGPESVAEVQEELRGGAVVSKRGVVRIDFDSGGWCTGAMIAPNYLITSAHCLRDIQDPGQGDFFASVTYFDPDGGERIVHNGRLYGYRKTRGDHDVAPDDLGVVQKVATWAGTDTDDYLRLSRGTEDQIKHHNLYAHGATNSNQDEDTADRKLRYIRVTNEWANGSYFIHRASSEAGVCMGDSGGVHIAKTDDDESFRNVIVGLHSNHDPPGVCARDGKKERALRMNDENIEWIERAMGRECEPFADNGHRYKRCFSD